MPAASVRRQRRVSLFMRWVACAVVVVVATAPVATPFGLVVPPRVSPGAPFSAQRNKVVVPLAPLWTSRRVWFVPPVCATAVPAEPPSSQQQQPPQPTTTKTSWVTRIESDEAFLSAMRESQEKLVLIKFFASWCRACKTIEPRFRRLAAEFHDEASFFEIEFSAQKELCRRLGIKKLPCVQFYRGADGCLDTVLCGPAKFPDVRAKLEGLVEDFDVPHDPDVPEFTDVSRHYNASFVDVAGGGGDDRPVSE